MANVINRINNEFDFNYRKFVKNNNIAAVTQIKQVNSNANNYNSKFNNINEPVKMETMNFETDGKTKEKDVEVLNLNN